MDAAAVFRQGFPGSMIPFHPSLAPAPIQYKPKQPLARKPVGHGDNSGDSGRIAHTLTACCRCRQRKTRCDPTLPRCLPCERSGSVCEYYDSTKGKKISRYYVIKLQDKVRALEAELGQYTDEDDVPRNTEDIVRPGGLVRLSESDETPRYLGPSSGIAMTRILMEEAKRYTDSKRISELIPQIRVRKQGTRTQSIAFGPSARKKSYPMISAHPAENLPIRQIADRLVDVFRERAQVFIPALHEKQFIQDLEDVYAKRANPYKNFVVRMVLAISLQKLDLQYAGLADSYYLSAMGYFEDVVRPKDWRTLQCLVLIAQYSMLTPTRTAVYYIMGLATRICQQLGLDAEKTILSDVQPGMVDPLTLDMKRRLAWAVASHEFGLAQSMGRPNGFAKGNDLMDVQYFSTVDDEFITQEGIRDGPPCEKKLVAIHFCKMRVLQAEIRRMLYERKRPEPRDENHTWFRDIEQRMEEWVNASPKSPAWCKPWFTGRHHSMLIILYRPSPQVPQPSSRSARRCFESAAHVINLSSQQMIKAAVDITWVFLHTLFTSVNALLWSVSYADVRAAHKKEEAEKLVNTALEIMDQCVERWPGTASAAQLYPIFAKACLHSYNVRPEDSLLSSGKSLALASDTDSPTPADLSSGVKQEPNSPSQDRQQQQQPPVFNPPQFGYVFDATPETMNTNLQFDDPFQPGPQFRSNSIFLNPATDQHGRRFSFFPPDMDDPMANALPSNHPSAAPSPMGNSFPSPPESVSASDMSTPRPGMNQSSPATTMRTTPTPTMSHAHPSSINSTPVQPPSLQQTPQAPHQVQRTPAFTIPPPHHAPHQRPLPPPTTVTDWFNPSQSFIPPYTFPSSHNFVVAQLPQGDFGANGPPGTNYSFLPERQGSLSHQQQMELMNVLENEGLGDIDTFLNTGMGLAGGGVDGGLTMQAWAQ